MATLAELADLRTSLTDPVVDHLLRLTASWSLLADLSFSDMLLMARVDGPDSGDGGFVVLGSAKGWAGPVKNSCGWSRSRGH